MRPNRFLFATWLGLVLLVLGLAGPAQAFPTAPLVTKSWELDFTSALPQAIAVRDLDGEYHWYWYISYKVVNLSGADRLYVPEFTVATDQGDILPANRNISTDVYKAIQDRLANRLLDTPTRVVGPLLQGADQAKESLIVWPAFGHDVAQVSVFVSGLAGETVTITNPQTGDKVLLSRTLKLDFEWPGRSATPGEQTVLKTGRSWIMR